MVQCNNMENTSIRLTREQHIQVEHMLALESKKNKVERLTKNKLINMAINDFYLNRYLSKLKPTDLISTDVDIEEEEQEKNNGK